MALPELFANPPTPGGNVPWVMTTLGAAVTTTPAAGTVETWTFSTAPPASLAQAGQFRIVIDNEICLDVTGGGGTSRQIQRGADGSTPATHANGASIYHILTRDALKNFMQTNASSSSGDVTGPLLGPLTITQAAKNAMGATTPTVQSSNYVASIGDEVLMTGSNTVTLPAGQTSGRVDVVALSGAVTVNRQGNSDTITYGTTTGQTSFSVSAGNRAIFRYIGGVWYVENFSQAGGDLNGQFPNPTVGGGWQSWTPVIQSAAGGNNATMLGNSTLVGSYLKFGKTCHFEIYLLCGSTWNGSTGQISFQGPFPCDNTVYRQGTLTSWLYSSYNSQYWSGTGEINTSGGASNPAVINPAFPLGQGGLTGAFGLLQNATSGGGTGTGIPNVYATNLGQYGYPLQNGSYLVLAGTYKTT